MKRILCILLSLSLLLGTAVYALAEEEEEPEFSAEEEEEIKEEEKELESDGEVVTGEVYHEKTKEDFDQNSPALYTGIIRRDFKGITGAEDDLARLDSLLSEVHLIMHHSRAFEEAYHPHYRIIAKDIFESELKPLIDR